MRSTVRGILGFWGIGVIGVALTGSSVGCKRDAAGPPDENVVVGECYKPFFNAASERKVDDLKAVLSKATIAHMERDVFREGAVLEGWDDFAAIYSDMKISAFIKDVQITGDRALIKDPVGGTFHCVQEDGTWRADLSDY